LLFCSLRNAGKIAAQVSSEQQDELAASLEVLTDQLFCGMNQRFPAPCHSRVMPFYSMELDAGLRRSEKEPQYKVYDGWFQGRRTHLATGNCAMPEFVNFADESTTWSTTQIDSRHVAHGKSSELYRRRVR
jgi:hypothetical protein